MLFTMDVAVGVYTDIIHGDGLNVGETAMSKGEVTHHPCNSRHCEFGRTYPAVQRVQHESQELTYEGAIFVAFMVVPLSVGCLSFRFGMWWWKLSSVLAQKTGFQIALRYLDDVFSNS